MSVTITPKLREYLNRCNTPFLCVDIANAKSCGGAIGETYAFVPKGHRIDTAQTEAVRSIDCDGITVLVLKRAIKFDDDASLDLRTFLGLKDVTTKGIYL